MLLHFKLQGSLGSMIIYMLWHVTHNYIINFVKGLFPLASKAHCRYTSLHKYVIMKFHKTFKNKWLNYFLVLFRRGTIDLPSMWTGSGLIPAKSRNVGARSMLTTGSGRWVPHSIPGEQKWEIRLKKIGRRRFMGTQQGAVYKLCCELTLTHDII